MLARVYLDKDERRARETARLVRESEMEAYVRVTPTPDDEDDE